MYSSKMLLLGVFAAYTTLLMSKVAVGQTGTPGTGSEPGAGTGTSTDTDTLYTSGTDSYTTGAEGGISYTECFESEACSEQTISDTDGIKCYGYLGCDSVTFTGDEAQMYGAVAGYQATIESESVDSYGYRGLYDASVSAATIDAFGYFSLQESGVQPLDSELSVQLSGLMSGFGSTISCYDGNNCVIECGTAGGCYNLQFVCYSGATCFYNCDDDPENCPTLVGGGVFTNAISQEKEKSDLSNAHPNSQIGLTDAETDAFAKVSAKARKKRVSKYSKDTPIDVEIDSDLLEITHKYVQQQSGAAVVIPSELKEALERYNSKNGSKSIKNFSVGLNYERIIERGLFLVSGVLLHALYSKYVKVGKSKSDDYQSIPTI